MAERKTPAEEAADLRAATREAHEAMQGLRDLLRDVETVRQRVEQTATEVFSERMAGQIEASLASYQETIRTAIDEATAAVFKRFDTIADTMLGETKAHQRKGEPSMSDYAAQIAQMREAPPESRP